MALTEKLRFSPASRIAPRAQLLSGSPGHSRQELARRDSWASPQVPCAVAPGAACITAYALRGSVSRANAPQVSERVSTLGTGLLTLRRPWVSVHGEAWSRAASPFSRLRPRGLGPGARRARGVRRAMCGMRGAQAPGSTRPSGGGVCLGAAAAPGFEPRYGFSEGFGDPSRVTQRLGRARGLDAHFGCSVTGRSQGQAQPPPPCAKRGPCALCLERGRPPGLARLGAEVCLFLEPASTSIPEGPEEPPSGSMAE